MPQRHVINASVSPKGSLETLSQREVQQLSEVGTGSLYTLFRQCALAILNTGAHVDNAKTILEAYKDFEVRIHQQDRGVRLELLNAPADAFVDGEMIASTREMLFSALRDIVYTESELASQRIDLESSQGITDYRAADTAREVKVCLRPGDAVVHHGGMIHRAEANRSATRHRRAFAMVMQGESCRRDEEAYARYMAALKQQHEALGVQP